MLRLHECFEMSSSPEKAVKIELRLLSPGMAWQENSLAERHMLLKILNVGNNQIRLDRRLLSVVLLVDLYDETGLHLANVPPSIPHPFTQEEVVIISPNESWEREFRLDQVTVVELIGTKYRIQACYDSQRIDYPVELSMWRGKVCSKLMDVGR
jgi:hypothetical protein